MARILRPNFPVALLWGIDGGLSDAGRLLDVECVDRVRERIRQPSLDALSEHSCIRTYQKRRVQ